MFSHTDKQLHPWQSSIDSFKKTTLPKLTEIGKAIGDSARNGDPAAKECIQLYATLERSFDPLTLFRLDEAIKKYEKKQLETPQKS